MTIHPTAIISDNAHIDPTAKIGAYCIIGDDVSIGAGCVLMSHVVIRKNTKIGQNNKIYQFASIGEDCQDLKYAGEETWLEIGDNNLIREACSFHRGTVQDGGVTKIGSHNLFMVNTHIAHDCVVGNHNILANNVGVAGHVRIGDYVVIGGNAGIHQFCHVAHYAMIAAASLIIKDVMAFTTVSGNPAKVRGLNIEGMRRKSWSSHTISQLRQAYQWVFRSGLTTDQAIAKLKPMVADEPKIQLMIDSLTNSRRGIVR